MSKINQVKVIYLSPEVVLMGWRRRPFVGGLPDDAEVVRVYLDHNRMDQYAGGVIGLVVRSGEFPEVLEGQVIPELRVTLHSTSDYPARIDPEKP